MLSGLLETVPNIVPMDFPVGIVDVCVRGACVGYLVVMDEPLQAILLSVQEKYGDGVQLRLGAHAEETGDHMPEQLYAVRATGDNDSEGAWVVAAFVGGEEGPQSGPGEETFLVPDDLSPTLVWANLNRAWKWVHYQKPHSPGFKLSVRTYPQGVEVPDAALAHQWN
jgi:hypothetical protein